MKILYIAKHNAPDTDMQCDLLFLGLRAVLGTDVVDVAKATRAYADSFGEGKLFPKEELSFTLGGLLQEDNVDRSDILNKIKTRYFDYIFYGSIHRDKTFMAEVFDVYLPSRRIFIDGEDETSFSSEIGRGFYFKRELMSFVSYVEPIQFAIPKQKIINSVPQKVRLMAPAPPHAMATDSLPGHDKRIYDKESDYYQQYSESYFGLTKKKGGWNTLRHLEIMAAGCMPYFEGLENCPASMMVNLPKSELLEAKKLYDACGGDVDKLNQTKYWDLFYNVGCHLRERLTTEALAKQVLDRIMR